ncbi:MAG: hypothetical protein R3293_26365 [Candidatus Promineifilaceae bacterium]|nr:hypothetical protein [Candidatus Promineifilaceae bacterium]
MQKFEKATCGMALWQPTLPRAAAMIEKGIASADKAVNFWHRRDPELFSFLY